MKNIGYGLISLSFVVTSLLSVLDRLQVNWTYFIITLIVGAIGILLVRKGTVEETMHEDVLAGNMKTIEESLTQILADVRDIRDAVDESNPQKTHDEIDAKLLGNMTLFVDARKTIGHLHGLTAYADVMNYYATRERYINRVWSASTDGYIDEVVDYMGRSEEQFAGALAVVQKLKL